MMEYTYEVTLDAPLGKKRGLLVLNAIARDCRGVLSLMSFSNPVRGSVDVDGACTLMGRMRTLVRNLPFTAEGRIDLESLELTLHWGGRSYALHGSIRET